MSSKWSEIVDGTWPAVRIDRQGPFTLREGQGGGSRVSAASVHGPFSEADIDQAEQTMLAMDQHRLFAVWPGDEALDQSLIHRGYSLLDPVNLYCCPVAKLMDRPIPRVTVFPIWEPLAIMCEIWAEAGIGPARLAVMNRAEGPKTALFLRNNSRTAGTAFVAIANGVAMVHALEIAAPHRRQGLGQWAIRAAAFWAHENGADTMSAICTRANIGANELYRSLGMHEEAAYHYRILKESEGQT